MTGQHHERPGWGQRVILAFCVASVALFVEWVVGVISLVAIGVKVWPPEAFNGPLVWGVGALMGCAATVVTFLCTHPVHRWLGVLGICLAFAVTLLADQRLHVLLPAVLAGSIRLATPTRQTPAVVGGAT
jgi:hypothetical protein